MKIVLLGPPGAGKGTQSQMLVKTFNFLQISTGDILRDAVKNKTELGEKAKMYMDKGELVPDEIIISLIEDIIYKNNKKDMNIIFDGFPRTVVQAQGLEKLMENYSDRLDAVVSMNVKDEILISRLTSRRICPTCNTVYNLITTPPKNDEICDNDGTRLIQRDDDKLETVRNRLKVYREQTEALVDFYKKIGILKEVNAECKPEEVFKNIVKALGLNS